jgi:hypothetical protein
VRRECARTQQSHAAGGALLSKRAARPGAGQNRLLYTKIVVWASLTLTGTHPTYSTRVSKQLSGISVKHNARNPNALALRPTDSRA